MAGRMAGLLMAGLAVVAGGRTAADEDPVKTAIIASINGPKKKRWWEKQRSKNPYGDGGKRICPPGMRMHNPKRQQRRRLEEAYMQALGRRLTGRQFKRMRREERQAGKLLTAARAA